MDFKVFAVLIHLGFGFVMGTFVKRREYHYVEKKMNWTEAQKYCRKVYTDLATFESMDDINRLSDRPQGLSEYLWIGLHDDPKSWEGTMNKDANSWKWSTTGNPSSTGYQNWEPSSRPIGSDTCMRKAGSGFWRGLTCGREIFFMCYDVIEGSKQYNLIQLSKTWKEAQSYCRSFHKDLALIENERENQLVTEVQSGVEVWIGLYRERWTWSDGSRSSFKNWNVNQPDPNGQYCTLEAQDHLWEDVPCDMHFPFICYTVVKVKKKIILKMRIQTTADLSDLTARDKIIQQLNSLLVSKSSATGFKLTWNVAPKRDN